MASAERDQAHWEPAHLHLCIPATSASQHSLTHGRTLKENVFRAWMAVLDGHSLRNGSGTCRPCLALAVSQLCAGGPGDPATFGAICRQEEMASLVLGACLCFKHSLSAQRMAFLPLLPHASLQYQRKQVGYSCKKRKSEKGGGYHRQTPLKATGCSFTFTLFKNVS